MDGRAREEIERTLMQFDRNQAAAGPLNSVVNRILDILPTVVRVAEVLHSADLSERESRLMLRLQIGLPAAMVPIGLALGTELTRAQYLALHAADLTTAERLKDVEHDQLLAICDADPELQRRVLEAGDQIADLEHAA